jgi:hypothetical protein
MNGSGIVATNGKGGEERMSETDELVVLTVYFDLLVRRGLF